MPLRALGKLRDIDPGMNTRAFQPAPASFHGFGGRDNWASISSIT
jgi:hypothetical protein